MAQGEHHYVLGRDDAETTRLQAQHDLWSPVTEAFLDRLEIPAGARCAELGCGPGLVLGALRERAGEGGAVEAVDAAMAGVDLALWDIKGKFYKQPIWRLLGGRHHDRVPAYASILFGKAGSQPRDIAQRWRELAGPIAGAAALMRWTHPTRGASTSRARC